MCALEALEALIQVIKSNEAMSIKMVLANESNSPWRLPRTEARSIKKR
jgi:hypothetical protein